MNLPRTAIPLTSLPEETASTIDTNKMFVIFDSTGAKKVKLDTVATAVETTFTVSGEKLIINTRR